VKADVDLEAAKVRGWLKPELLDSALHGAAMRAVAAGDYDTAVFEAFKAVESAVRMKGGYLDTEFGVELMHKAFDPTNGPLRDPGAKISRREARRNLFMGAMGELRNPKAHGDPTITDPREAIEDMMTANLLLRMVLQPKITPQSEAEYTEILNELLAEESKISEACKGGSAYQVHLSEAGRGAIIALFDKANTKLSKLRLQSAHAQIPDFRDYLTGPVELITVYHRFRSLTQAMQREWDERKKHGRVKGARTG
jgi:uncharacterized protein (TIGR02391 family)